MGICYINHISFMALLQPLLPLSVLTWFPDKGLREVFQSHLLCLWSFPLLMPFSELETEAGGDYWYSLGTLIWMAQCSGQSRCPIALDDIIPAPALPMSPQILRTPCLGVMHLGGGHFQAWVGTAAVRRGAWTPVLTGPCVCPWCAPSTCTADSQVRTSGPALLGWWW